MEWESVVASGELSMVGRLHAIIGEKHSEVVSASSAPQPPNYKARVVFGGHAIQTSTRAPAETLFQEMSGPPSTMTDARIILGVSALTPGSQVTTRDAEQAYVQSCINTAGRPKTYVRLPKSMQPPSWAKYKDPVCVLDKALYGHPESGAIWDKFLSSHLKLGGWHKVEGHPSLYFSPKTKAVSVSYTHLTLPRIERCRSRWSPYH